MAYKFAIGETVGMRCQNCVERIQDAFEAYAREACPDCGAPLNEKVPFH